MITAPYWEVMLVALKSIVTSGCTAARDSSGENEAGGSSRGNSASATLSVEVATFLLAFDELNLSPLLGYL